MFVNHLCPGFAPRYLGEMQGIADAIEVDIDDIILVNM